VAGKKYDQPPFTLCALSMFMVDFWLQIAVWPNDTKVLPMSDICQL
jgi:hypothetical protein